MAYWKDTWKFPGSIEYEYKWAGNYGAKGESRGKKKKATPEQIRKQNQYQKEKKMRRLVKANFERNDLWCTLKYVRGIRKSIEDVKKDFDNFIRSLKRKYRKKEEDLKFIYRIEIGANGGIHIHFLCNRSRGTPETDIMIQESWKSGRVNYESLYDAGGYDDLAKYIVKEANEDQMKQLSLFTEYEQKKLSTFGSSRNLIRPVPERKIYKRKTLRKMLEEGIKPTKGYYIDKNSIEKGINPYTGMTYLHYTEVRIDPGGDG